MKGNGNSIEISRRIFDVGFASLTLLALSPALAAIAAGIYLTTPGGAFYSQERLGKGRKPFVMYKFRTMYKDSENNGPQLTLPNDPRVTRFGRFLRKFHLDELPQFWNVIKGDMTLIGPRPEREIYANRIEKIYPPYNRLFSIRPGITSSGMISYGYASDVDGMVERAHHDVDYLDNKSLKTDARILLTTVSTIFKGKGI